MRKSPSLSLLTTRPFIRFLTAILSLCLILLPLSDRGREQGSPLPLTPKNIWTGDLDWVVEDRIVRFLVVDNTMFYFLDGATQRGIAYELGKKYKKRLCLR